MTDFEAVPHIEAHPTRDEYVLERALSDGGWVVESITPAATAEKAEERHAALSLPWVRDAEFRVVRRTITSTVVSIRPSAAPTA
ncbi:hypothetical protein O3Q52_36225 [Streptomyces sp. ActVer]|uniref:hypothetical protein n=1 Tax=Streptomyces sp. ActVer TaxID=3014558 RepID=UPI0022B5B638|nr:hypothetical protein [Streptomyces sp. ActVer]MCZ4513502.1 hypothetical protein [Streptomyces sp. ActVer]